MRLKEVDKKELRRMLEDGINKLRKDGILKPGERVNFNLSKDLLEDILFDSEEVTLNPYIFYQNKNTKIKYLTWTGDFLSYLDLSSVSFDNVLWNIKCDKYTFDQKTKRENYYTGVNSIILHDTNAKIDFLRSFDIMYLSQLNLHNCNISDTDLSNNTLDLDSLSMSLDNCNIKNTGINIEYTPNRGRKIDIDRLIKSNKLDGCYINGKKIIDGTLVDEEKEEITDYDKNVQDIKASIKRALQR